MDIYTIIQTLNYDRLVNLRVIPPCVSPIYKLAKKRVPQWSKDNPQDYINHIKGLCLSTNIPKNKADQNIVAFKNRIFDGHLFAANHTFIYKGISITPSASQCNGQWILEISGQLKPTINDYLVCLSMLAIIRGTGLNINYTGIIYPAHEEHHIIDCSTWNSQSLLDVLLQELDYHKEDNPIQCSLDKLLTPTTGHHVINTYSGYPNNVAYQIFLPKDDQYLNNVKYKIAQSTGKCFVHSTFAINLCNPDTYPGKLLAMAVQSSVYIGAKGVVVHLGTSKDLPLDQAINNMENNLRLALPHTTIDCPILVETSAGEGTEVCSSIEELHAFINRFSMEDNIKLCVDTCHVFAAGYPPELFLQKFITWTKLVHYNDSKKGRGQRRDLHAQPGSGQIGYHRMLAVRDLCIAHSISMVIE